MKPEVYAFISKYLDNCCKRETRFKLSYLEINLYFESIEKIKKLTPFFIKIIDDLQVSSPKTIETIKKLQEQEILYTYCTWVYELNRKRKSLHLSKRDLSTQTGISMTTISNFENLEFITYFNNILILLKALKIQVIFD